MPDSSADRDPVDRLAEEFAQRLRQGERPSIAEYVERHPEHADAIRELFPALEMMEQLKPASGDATGPALAPSASMPERLGDHRILREIGRGGMGVVYEAEQVSLGRHVALKVLPPAALLDPQHLERFHREAKAAARLHHTNIVPVYGVGEYQGVHFYAMQYIQGQGLDAVLNELRRVRDPKNPASAAPGGALADVTHSLLTGRFLTAQLDDSDDEERPSDPTLACSVPDAAPVSPSPSGSLSLSGSGQAYWRSVARVGLQVADALAYAHSHGVLHRDIKPSNLLLDVQGIVWITDFGLAKSVESGDLTSPGEVVGTVRYMAPERFQGRTDARSDLYALGLTLYELLTLRPAFEESDVNALLIQVVRGEVTPPRRVDPRVPRDLETIVLKAIATDPARRYQKASELAEDLRCFLEDRPIQARRTSLRERLWRWVRRNPAVASLSLAVLLLLVLLAAGSFFAAMRLRAERDLAVENETRAREAEQRAANYLEMLEFYRVVQRDPGTLESYRGKRNQSFFFEVTGKSLGSIYGTDVYTDDSTLATAVVHAGLLRDGERGYVKVTILPGQERYEASTRHGITSHPYDAWSGSYRVEALSLGTQLAGSAEPGTAIPRTVDPSALPDPGYLIGYRGETGRSYLFEVVGATDLGSIYGTDVYTDDSHLAVAAVHAGILRPGERGTVRVTILEGKPSYRGSKRNGVTSRNWETPWDGSYRIEAVAPRPGTKP
jgi:serine/threonine protein kinase